MPCIKSILVWYCLPRFWAPKHGEWGSNSSPNPTTIITFSIAKVLGISRDNKTLLKIRSKTI